MELRHGKVGEGRRPWDPHGRQEERWNWRVGCMNGNRKQHWSRNKLFKKIVMGRLCCFEWQGQESKLILLAMERNRKLKPWKDIIKMPPKVAPLPALCRADRRKWSCGQRGGVGDHLSTATGQTSGLPGKREEETWSPKPRTFSLMNYPRHFGFVCWLCFCRSLV